MLALYAIRAMGGGDVKLLAAIGSLTGPQNALVILLATAIVGGVLAVFVALFHRRMLGTLKNLVCLMRFHAVRGLEAHPELNLANPSAVRLPYGLAIAGGTLYALLIHLRR
jgi:prepilin peptidase CpaA